MKQYIILGLLLTTTFAVVFAQDNIKRPDSYNYQSGIDAYYEEDFQKSMDFFDKELKQNPKNGYAMLWEAYIYDRYEKYGQAMSSVNQSLKFIPKKDKEWVAMAYGLRASVQAELGDTLKALSDYTQAFKTDPKEEYIYKKCNILNDQKKYSEIDAELKKAMALNDNNAVTYVYIGRNEESKGNNATALEKYSYAVKLDPNYSSAYSFRAAAYIETHKYKEACQDMISALSIGNDTKAFYQLYELADSAMIYLTPQLKAQQLKEPNQSKWSYYLGLAKAHVENYVEAEPAFREALRISEYEGQKSTLIYQNLAETLNELGKYAEALELTDIALSMDSTATRTWRERAEINYNMGNKIATIDNVSKAINLAPDYEILYSKRASYYMYNGMNRNALDDINTAISLDSEEPYYYIQRCQIYQRMGKDAEAEEDCKTVIAMVTAHPEAEQELQSLAYAYAHSGRKAEALPIIEKVYKDRHEKGTEYDLACMYSLVDEKEQALTHLEKALQLGYCEFVHIGNDFDLDNIRGTEKFKTLVSEYQKRYSDGVSDTDTNETEYIEKTIEVPFTKESGIYKVKCTINALPLHFYFDTGAADVTISSVEAQFMLKNDFLKPSDIKGKEYYGTASGEIAEGTVIVLKEVDFGGLKLTNVKASVVHNQKAPLLLGQTVLNRLGKIEIDYEKNILKITTRERK